MFRKFVEEIIVSRNAVLLDGGFATLLERNGISLNNVGEFNRSMDGLLMQWL